MADARLEGTQIADSVIDLIGGTPLVRMKRTMEIEQLPAVLAGNLDPLVEPLAAHFVAVQVKESLAGDRA